MKLLKGKLIADTLLSRLSEEILKLNLHPVIGVVLVGEDAASHLYVSLKERAAACVGIRVEKRLFSEGASQSDIERAIDSFNSDPAIHGILVQVPLPPFLNQAAIIKSVALEKDVDGFHPENERRFVKGETGIFPVFPKAILELIRSSGSELSGKSAVVIGNSRTFGDVMCEALLREGIHPIFIPFAEYASEENLRRLKSAEIVVSACGKERMITGAMLRQGAIVIDGGIVKDGSRVVGDIDRASVEALDGFLSPVPGGVGPVTIACLLSNVVESAKRQQARIR